MDPAFEVREVQCSNLGRFTEIFRLCFGVEVGCEYFRWKYFENPAGPVIAFEALHDGRVAGFYGVIPEWYCVNGERRRVFQSMDTMTHPEYRRRGLFAKLAERTYRRVSEISGRLDLIGVPGPESLPGFVDRLAWRQIHSFRWLVLPRQWFQLRSLFRSSEAAHVEPATELDPASEDYFARREQSNNISPALYPELIEWRVLRNPSRTFNLVTVRDGEDVLGICIYSMDETWGRCFVYLLDFVQPICFSRYAAAVARFLFRQTGARVLLTWEPLNETIRTAYAHLGFVSSPLSRGPFSSRVPLIVRSESGELSGQDWYDIRNYDLQPLMQN